MNRHPYSIVQSPRITTTVNMSDYFENIPIELPPSGTPPRQHPSRKKTQKSRNRKSVPRRRTVVRQPKPIGKGSQNAVLWALAVVVLFALYSVVGFKGVPYYIQNILPESLLESTGFSLDPGAVSFNPYTFEIRSKDLFLSRGKEQVAKIEEVGGRLSFIHLLRRDLVINDLTILQPTISLIRNPDRSYNISPLLGGRKAGSDDFMHFSDLPFFFSLNNIKVAEGQLTFNDIPTKKKHELTNIELNLPTLSNIPVQLKHYIRPSFSAVINGSPVQLTGQAWLGDGKQETRLSTSLDSIDIANYSEYLPFSLPFSVSQGIASGKVDLSFRPSSSGESSFVAGFSLNVTGAILTSRSKQLQLKAPSVTLKGELNPVKKQLNFSRILVNGSELASYGPSIREHLEELFSSGVAPSETPAAQTSVRPYTVSIASLKASETTVRFYSKNKAKKPSSIWNTLNIQLKDYTPEKSQEGNTFGSVTCSGSGSDGKKTFHWKATFQDALTLSGPLKLERYEVQDILNTFGAPLPFTLKGSTRLDGILTAQIRKTPKTAISLSLQNGDSLTEKFSMTAGKDFQLKSPRLVISNISFLDKHLMLGNVAIEKGQTFLGYAIKSNSFRPFTKQNFAINNFSYSGKASLSTEPANKKRLELKEVFIAAKNLNDKRAPKDNINLLGKLGDEGKITLLGSCGLSPFSLTLKGAFTGIPAQESLRWFSHSSSFDPISGSLSGSGLFAYPQKLFRGDLNIQSGRWNKGNQTVLKWKDLSLNDLNFTEQPNHLGIREAILAQGEGVLNIKADSPHPLLQLAQGVRDILYSGDKNKAVQKKITISPFDIQSLKIVESNLTIQDERGSTPFEYMLSNISGIINDIHGLTSAKPAPYTLTATFFSTPLTMKGSIYFRPSRINLTQELTLEALPVRSLDPFFTQGLHFSEGKCSLKITDNFSDTSFTRSGGLNCIDLKSESLSSDSLLVLAMQTDEDGIFNLPIDVQLPRQDSVNRISKDLLTRFRALGVKASISPLLLASDDYSDLIDNETITFRPGEFMLTSEGREKLVQYTSLLISHPHIGFKLTGVIDPEKDRQALQKQLEEVEQKRVEAENKKRYSEWQRKKDLFDAALAQRVNTPQANPNTTIVESDIPRDILSDFVPLQPEPVTVSEQMLQELAEKRIKVLIDSLSAQLSLTKGRLKSVQAPATTVSGAGDEPGVKITIQPLTTMQAEE